MFRTTKIRTTEEDFASSYIGFRVVKEVIE